MSRTYRVRHCKTKYAAKFVDGNVGLHREQVHNRFYAIILHGVYGYPCNIAGQPLVTYPTSSFDYAYMGWDSRTHNTRCCPNDILLRRLSGMIREWPFYAAMGTQPIKVASLHYHPWASRTYRENRSGNRHYRQPNSRYAAKEALRVAAQKGPDGFEEI